MANIVFNIAKGKFAQWATLPATNDALVAIPIETSGIETDAILRDYDSVLALLAASNNEQATMGRKTLANVVVSVDDTADRVKVTCDPIVWASATGSAISALVIAYDADTTAGTDTDLIPCLKLDCVGTPGGGNFTYTPSATDGIYTAS